jgi:hypothetical protein
VTICIGDTVHDVDVGGSGSSLPEALRAIALDCDTRANEYEHTARDLRLAAWRYRVAEQAVVSAPTVPPVAGVKPTPDHQNDNDDGDEDDGRPDDDFEVGEKG